MVTWDCPYAIRLKPIKGIGCGARKNVNTDINTVEGALSVYCACQRYCPDERRIINSEGAKQCYEKMKTNSNLV